MTEVSSELDPGTAFLLEAFEPQHRADPYPLFARTRAQSPVLDGGSGLWFTLTHNAAHTLLRARNVSSDERRSNEYQANVDTDPILQRHRDAEPLMLFTDPPDHTRLRSLVSRAFTPRTVERMRPRLEALATELLDTIDSAGPVDFIEQVAYPFPVAVICELLGVPKADAVVFGSMSDRLTLGLEPNALRTQEQEIAIEEAQEELSAYLAGLFEDRRQNPGEDLISGLLAVRDGDDRLSEPELINMVILLLVAGHETTVNLLGNGLVALLRNPDQLAAWRADPGLGHNAVDELTRYDSPVQMAMRVLLEPTTIEGVAIPAFDQVVTILGAANRDPKVFQNPDRLDFTRHNAGANMSFGGGIHHCLGMALAKTEAEILLGALVQRFGQIELVEEPEPRARFVLRGFEEILIAAG